MDLKSKYLFLTNFISFSKVVCFFILLLSASVLLAQKNDDSKNEIIEQKVEYLLENADENTTVDYTTLFEQLTYFFEHPINLNRADVEDLKSLMLLTDIQINNLIDHINTNGKLITLEELQTINGFDLSTIKLILPFVKVSHQLDSPKITPRELINNGTSHLFVRYSRVLEEKKGFSDVTDSTLTASPNSRYIGDENKYYTRYKYTYGRHVSLGFTAEKDAGEEFFKGTQTNGFDYYSGHLFLRNQGKLKQLAIGDFHAQYGQGLTFWTGAAFGKSADVMLVKRNPIGLKPYTSVDENLFLRGAGTTFLFNKIEFSNFYSSNKIDANIDFSDSTSIEKNQLAITSIQSTGFHRTPNELEDKNAITKEQFGGNIAYKTRRFTVGLTGVHSKINANYNPNLQVYSNYRNANNEQTNIGANYNWVVKNFNFFGEVSNSINYGSAYTAGALLVLDPRISVSVLHRNFDRNFHPISSAAISENSVNENEQGTYFGAVFKPVRKLIFSGYYDQFTFPWLKYQVNAPSKGYQYLAQVTYKPNKKLEMYVRVRDKLKGKNTQFDNEGIDEIVNEHLTNYRYNFTYQVTESVKLKSRVEFSEYKRGKGDLEKGYLVYQDIIYKPLSKPFSFSFRYGVFDTDTYNSRIYAYENDVLYSFSIPAYYNKGVRTYLTLRYKIVRGIDVWLRYASTIYNNIDVISSGLEEIQGNTKSEVKFQVRFKF